MNTDSAIKIAQSNRELQEVTKRNQKEILKKEEAIQKLNEAYKENVKKAQEEETATINTIRNENIKQISDENLKKNQTLQELSKSLTQMQSKLEHERNLLTNNNEIEIDRIKDTFRNKLSNVTGEGLKRSDELNEISENALTKIKQDREKNIEQLNEDSYSAIGNLVNENRSKYAQTQQTFNDNYQTTLKQNEVELIKLRSDQKNEMKKEEFGHRDKLKNMEISHKVEIDKLTGKNQQELQQSSDRFAKKFKEQSVLHNEMLNKINNVFQSKIDDLKKHYTKLKETIVDKSNDDFYTPSVLDVDLKNQGKFYQVSLKVPPHEKDSVQISGNVRNIRLSLGRSYNDQIKNSDNSINKSNRTETYIKEFEVDDVINDRLITKAYDNDNHLLTFSVPKL